MIYKFFDQYSSPINHAFFITKPNISFVTSILLCDIALQSIELFYHILLEFAIIYQYIGQYLSPKRPVFL